jgi:hydrophobe/amphiphile efflux-1 (HAE1) family protein
MNISAIAIKRPVFTVMVTVALLVLGAVGLSRLGTDLFPDVTFPVIAVNIVYPGASPEEVENLVSKPLEDTVVSLNGLDRLVTDSREGLSTTLVFFKLGVDIQEAATLVREKVAQVRYKLPQEVKEPAVLRLDPSATPVLIYTLHGQGSLSQIRKYADDVLRPSLEQVDGVAAVRIKGGADREVHVDLDLSRLDALGLSPETISGVLRGANITVPAGHYDESTREISVRAVGELVTVEQIRDLVVATAKDGSAVRLRDVASVEDGWEEMRTRIRANGDEAVSFEVVKQSGRNTVAVADLVRVKLAELEKAFPAGMSADLILDTSAFIRENAHEVEIAIVFGGAMAILIILVFMLDLRSTIISAFALPTSVISTFFLMYVLGFTLNMMTLLGLSLAIGLLIDDAVVVRENIFKHLERGEPPREAALRGTEEIALSVLATTLTIVAVFVPVAFMTGIIGQFFRQFGLTVSAAVLLSLFVAFTLDPMLSSRFSKSIDHTRRDPFAPVKRPFEVVFKAMDDTYRDLLGWSLRHKLAVGGLALGSLVGVGYILGIMGADFVNAEDRSQMVLDVELPAGTSLDETSRRSGEIERDLLADPLIKTVFVTLGPDGDVNKTSMRILTVPKQKRTVGLLAIKNKVRALAAEKAPGAKVVITDPPFVEGAGTQAAIMILCRGTSYDTLAPYAEKVGDVLHGIPGVTDIQVRYTPGRPEMRVEIDRQRLADQGLAVAQVAMGLRTAMEGEEAGKMRQGKDEVPIRVRLRSRDRAGAADLSRISLRSPKGLVALSDVAHLERGEGPQVIEREARMRQIQVWATPNGRSLGDIVKDLTARMDKLEAPAGVTFTYDGQIKQMMESNASVLVSLLLGVVFIYLVLASQFESFIHPLTIMLTLPLAIVGAVLGLFLTKNTVAMGSLIGIILLMGLVTKNAILLVDRAIVRVREQGEPPHQAILEAGPERLRPILMTSAAMVLGMLPTALSNGDGSEFRAPMAIAVIGGVVSSTFLSLVVVPAFYLAIENAKARLFGKRTPEAAPVAHAGGE